MVDLKGTREGRTWSPKGRGRKSFRLLEKAVTETKESAGSFLGRERLGSDSLYPFGRDSLRKRSGERETDQELHISSRNI